MTNPATRMKFRLVLEVQVGLTIVNYAISYFDTQTPTHTFLLICKQK